MTEQSFIEMFPEIDTIIVTESEDVPAMVYCDEIYKHCLSKQRVREAIRKCKKVLYEFSDGGSIDGIDMSDLWEELEL